jgi:hypothetical protein
MCPTEQKTPTPCCMMMEANPISEMLDLGKTTVDVKKILITFMTASSSKMLFADIPLLEYLQLELLAIQNTHNKYHDFPVTELSAFTEMAKHLPIHIPNLRKAK